MATTTECIALRPSFDVPSQWPRWEEEPLVLTAQVIDQAARDVLREETLREVAELRRQRAERLQPLRRNIDDLERAYWRPSYALPIRPPIFNLFSRGPLARTTEVLHEFLGSATDVMLR